MSVTIGPSTSAVTRRHTADVAVVGASLAGCTVALLLARAGLRVVLLDKHRRPDAYKPLCTHYIQPSAVPTIRRLGLADDIEAAGGVRADIDLWTRYGWVVGDRDGDGHDDGTHGYAIRRSVLDPMLRGRAAGADGVAFLPGFAVRELCNEGGRVTGVRARAGDGGEVEVAAHLVVGADGRASTVAGLAGSSERERPNQRCGMFASYTGVRLASGERSQMWLLDPDVAYAFRNDGDVTVLAAMFHRDRWPEVQRDAEGVLLATVAALPAPPEIGAARRISNVMVVRDYPLVERQPVPRSGVALVGDAALTSDPMWGVGCGWAFQSGGWLADAVVPALTAGDDLDPGLRGYARRHRRALAGHQRLIADAASGRPLNPIERLMFSAAVHDARTARHLRSFAERSIGPARFLAPPALARAAVANLHRSRRSHVRAPGDRPDRYQGEAAR